MKGSKFSEDFVLLWINLTEIFNYPSFNDMKKLIDKYVKRKIISSAVYYSTSNLIIITINIILMKAHYYKIYKS